jgi:hypothetical protein
MDEDGTKENRPGKNGMKKMEYIFSTHYQGKFLLLYVLYKTASTVQ